MVATVLRLGIRLLLRSATLVYPFALFVRGIVGVPETNTISRPIFKLLVIFRDPTAWFCCCEGFAVVATKFAAAHCENGEVGRIQLGQRVDGKDPPVVERNHYQDTER